MRSLLGNLIPDSVKAVIDYHRFPNLVNGFDGPFNGQCGRQQLFIDLVRMVGFTHVIETGAFRGTTTEYLARETGLPTYSVESNTRSYYYARRRLRHLQHVNLFHGDSRRFLQDIASRLSPKARPFIYLDAHWYSDLPLREEMEIIATHFREFVVMVDDFCVPDDSGYKYDYYSDDKSLSLAYLATTIDTLGCSVVTPGFPHHGNRVIDAVALSFSRSTLIQS